MSARYPQRIVCLTEETTETLYLLGQGDRIVEPADPVKRHAAITAAVPGRDGGDDDAAPAAFLKQRRVAFKEPQSPRANRAKTGDTQAKWRFQDARACLRSVSSSARPGDANRVLMLRTA